MAKPRTTFPKGHTRCSWQTRNMSRELLDQAGRIAGLRAAANLHGATTETVILDAMKLALPQLEGKAETKRKELRK